MHVNTQHMKRRRFRGLCNREKKWKSSTFLKRTLELVAQIFRYQYQASGYDGQKVEVFGSSNTSTMCSGQAWASILWSAQLTQPSMSRVLQLSVMTSVWPFPVIWLCFCGFGHSSHILKCVPIMRLGCLPADITVITPNRVHFVKSRRFSFVMLCTLAQEVSRTPKTFPSPRLHSTHSTFCQELPVSFRKKKEWYWDASI